MGADVMQPAASLAESAADLRRWVADAVGDVPVTADPPDAPTGEPQVTLHLLGLGPARDLHGGDSAACIWFRARYLVTTRAATIDAANDLLEQLFVAAATTDGLESRLDALDAATWNSLQARPRPAFVIDVPVRHPREREPGAVVMFPLSVQGSGLRSLRGRLVSPGDVPISGAVVELAGTGTTTRTDATGGFRLPVVPTEPPTTRLRLTAKGRRFEVDVDLGAIDGDLVIRCDPLEA